MLTSSTKPRPVAVLVTASLSLAALIGCSGSETPPTEARAREDRSATPDAGKAERPAGPWSFTDDRGETVTLDEAPAVVAADAASAGGLWEYGIDVNGGVFGEVTRANGEPGPAIGLADPEAFESVGDSNQINLEALAALRPEVIVASMWSEDEYYGIAPAQVDEVSRIAPIIGIRVDERPVTEPLARIAELAASLGADPDGEIADAKAAFDDASQAFSAANEAQPDLLVVAASGSPTEMYVAYPPAWPDLRYFQELGMNLVEPKDHPTADGFWETLSWEQAGTYPADLVLADARGGSLEDLRAQIPATARSLPAIAQDQMVAWPAVHAYGYGNFASILTDLTQAVESADPTIGGS